MQELVEEFEKNEKSLKYKKKNQKKVSEGKIKDCKTSDGGGRVVEKIVGASTRLATEPGEHHFLVKVSGVRYS